MRSPPGTLSRLLEPSYKQTEPVYSVIIPESPTGIGRPLVRRLRFFGQRDKLKADRSKEA
jgi:hypothetical protein